MMNNDTYHILNGDVLAERLPKEIEGHRIVFREAFISGPVINKGHELDFWFNRQMYFSEKYKWNGIHYFTQITTEIFKIRQIKLDAKVNIWLETDLHCYSNLWFLCNLLEDKFPGLEVCFIVPDKNSSFGFESMIEEELITSYWSKENIDAAIIIELSNCWNAYCRGENRRLLEYGKELKSYLKHIDKIIEAHLSRIESNNSDAKPLKTLKSLIEQLGSKNYEKLFWEFTKREGFYGYRELEFKQLYDKVISLS